MDERQKQTHASSKIIPKQKYNNHQTKSKRHFRNQNASLLLKTTPLGNHRGARHNMNGPPIGADELDDSTRGIRKIPRYNMNTIPTRFEK